MLLELRCKNDSVGNRALDCRPMSESENSPNSSTEVSTPRAAPQTLGVLFVHGIGSQRRGDTLLSAGSAVHSWLKRWYEEPKSGITVDVAESHLAEADTKEEAPAHARIVFSQDGRRSSMTWLIAESRWAQTFFEPSFTALLAWCFRILPWVPLFYVLPRFRRAWTLGEAIQNAAKTGVMKFDTIESIMRDPAAAVYVARGTLFEQKSLSRLGLRLAGIQLFAGVKFALLAVASCLMAALLLAVFILTLISFGLLRSLAASVQRTLSATIGDSYFYVSNPMIRATILTKLESDLAWLEQQGCDEIVIVAHSQGAAIAYDTVRRLTEEKRRPEALKCLISYGSGLRRLFTLRRALDNPFNWNFHSAVGYVLTAVMCVALFWMITGTLSIFTSVVTVVVIVIVLDGMLLNAARTFKEDPALLDIDWTDLYASHDPVTGGALDIEERAEQEVDLEKMTVEEVSRIWTNKIAVRNFYRRQRQVFNLGSTMMDHVRYWDAPDDFVAAVTTELMRRTELPMQPWETSWLDVARERRRWRLSFLSACRSAALISIAGLFLSTECLSRAGFFLGTKTKEHPQGLDVLDWLVKLPNNIVGFVYLSVIVCLVYAIAAWGWRAFDKEEATRFFLRYPYRVAPLPFRFIAGWLALIAFLPMTSLALGVPLNLASPAVWAFATAIVLAIGKFIVSGFGPGSHRARALQLIEIGNELLGDPGSSGELHANHVLTCFSAAEKLLDSDRYRDDWAKAVLAHGAAFEQLDPKTGPEKALALYKRARDVLESAGKDVSELNSRISRARTA